MKQVNIAQADGSERVVNVPETIKKPVPVEVKEAPKKKKEKVVARAAAKKPVHTAAKSKKK